MKVQPIAALLHPVPRQFLGFGDLAFEVYFPSGHHSHHLLASLSVTSEVSSMAFPAAPLAVFAFNT